MVVQVVLPSLGGDGMTAKDLVISLLLEERSLNARQVWRRVNKRYGKSVSYQAVYKAIFELCGDSVLHKDEEKMYEINPAWVAKIKEFGLEAERSIVSHHNLCASF